MNQQPIRHFWELLWGMTEKELQARYKHTVFGFLWLVANPFLQMLIIGFIFPLFVKEPIPHYSYYLFSGLLAWNFVSLSLAKAAPSIVFERSLIKKAVFPRAVIPLSIVLSNLINYLAAFILYLVPLAYIGTLTLQSPVYFAFGLFQLIVVVSGMSLIVSSLNVRFRDINFFVQAILVLWFYMTPVVYALAQIPTSLRALWKLNPITAPIQYIQAALTGAPLPSFELTLCNGILVGMIGIFGVWMFNKESSNFDDWL